MNIKYITYHLTIILIIFFSLPSCQITPATGENDFSLISESEELEIGRQENKKIINQFGGIYNNKKIQNYVSSLGNFLVSTSELPNLKFTFTILDTELVNAFALPGGYIYLTRGLLAICQNEAQLAGVISHEIGHVTARHTAKRYTKTIGTGILANILGNLGNNILIENLINQSAGLYLLSYSREQEYQADKLAIRYMKRAGFKTTEMANFLRIMEEYSNFENRKSGNVKRSTESDLMSTHPLSKKRVNEVKIASKNNTPTNPIIGKQVFLRKIDGIDFGPPEKEGILLSNKFIHTGLKIKFDFSENFRFKNFPTHLVGTHINGNEKIVFDIDSYQDSSSLLNYLKKWTRNKNFIDYKEYNINELEAITTVIVKKKKRFRLFAIKNRKTIYRFILTTEKKEFSKVEKKFFELVNSFRLLKDNEISNYKTSKIRIFTIDQEESIESFYKKRNITNKFSKELFTIINDLKSKKLEAGDKVKVIVNESI